MMQCYTRESGKTGHTAVGGHADIAIFQPTHAGLNTAESSPGAP